MIGFIMGYMMVLSAISHVWEYIEVRLYGYSQHSIVDAVAGVYIAWRIMVTIVDYIEY